MAELYGRKCKVTIAIPVSTPGDFAHVTSDVIEINGGDDPENPGMRVQFEISRNSEKDPNTSQVIVTNLAPSTRGQLQKKGVKLTLEAGYESVGTSRLFIGDVRTTDHVRNGSDWDTTMKLGDGERAFKFARVSESFSPGVGAGDVLQYLAQQSGLAIGNIPTVVANLTTSFDQGYVAYGKWGNVFDRLVKSLGYVWSIQDGALQVLLPGQSNTAAVPNITPDSGLIGSPEMGTPEKKGKPALLKFRSLLTPVIPGGQVHLQSLRYDAFVRVKKVKHTGDTHGNEWYSDIEGVILG